MKLINIHDVDVSISAWVSHVMPLKLSVLLYHEFPPTKGTSLWKPWVATSISTFVLGFGYWVFEVVSMTSALDVMIKSFAIMILARNSDECFDHHTQNNVPPSQSEESYLKPQREGWNWGGHPRLPYFIINIILMSNNWDIHWLSLECDWLYWLEENSLYTAIIVKQNIWWVFC